MFKRISHCRCLLRNKVFCLLMFLPVLTSCDGDFLYVENKYPGVLACAVIVALVGGYFGYRLADRNRISAGILCALFAGAAGFALSDFIIM